MKSEFEKILDQILSDSKTFSNHQTSTQTSHCLNNAQIFFMQNRQKQTPVFGVWKQKKQTKKTEELCLNFNTLSSSQQEAYQYFVSEGAILGAAFTQAQIKEQWRNLVLTKHPDRNPNGSLDMQKLNSAYRVLKDAFKPSQQAA